MPTCPTCRSRFAAGVRVCPRDGAALAADPVENPETAPTALLLPDVTGASRAPTPGTGARAAAGTVETLPAAAGPLRRRGKRGASPPDKLCGKLVDGRYRILERIGEGGVGVVYAAEHIQLRRKVAVKVLHPLFAPHSEFRLRFEREAQAASRTSHPACVAVLDFGTFEARPYLVMEFVEGRLLSERLQEKPTSPSEAVLIARQVLGALRHAHSLGIIHRDVKPGNIMLCEPTSTGSHVKLLDFGLAKNLDSTGDAGALTQVGAVFGTPGYLSPEQAAGIPVDARSDLYSLGVVLFEMVCCRKPFASDDQLEVLQAHISAVPPRASTFRPEISPALEDVIARSLAKERELRFQTAEEFIEALTAVPEATFAGISGRVTAPPPAASAPSSGPTAAVATPPGRAAAVAPGATDRATATPAPAPATTAGARGVAPIAAAGAAPPSPGAPHDGLAARGWRPRFLATRRNRLALFAGGGLLALALSVALALTLASWLRGVSRPRHRGRPAATASAGSRRPARTVTPPVRPRTTGPRPGTASPPSPTGAPGPPAAPLPLPSPTLRRAEAALRSGHLGTAVRLARRAVAKQRNDPRARLVLGHAYYRKLWTSDALDEYAKAIAADPAVKSDPTVQSHAIGCLRHARTASRCRRFIVDTLGSAAIPALTEAARTHPDVDVRSRSAEILRTLGAEGAALR